MKKWFTILGTGIGVLNKLLKNDDLKAVVNESEDMGDFIGKTIQLLIKGL